MVTTAGTSPKSFVAEDARILKAINVLLNMFPYMRCFLRRITTVGAAVSFRPPFNHRLNSCQGIRSNDYIRFELFWICQGCSSKCLRLNDRLDIGHILLWQALLLIDIYLHFFIIKRRHLILWCFFFWASLKTFQLEFLSKSKGSIRGPLEKYLLLQDKENLWSQSDGLTSFLSYKSEGEDEDKPSAASWKTGYRLTESLCEPWYFGLHRQGLHQWSQCHSSVLGKMPALDPGNHPTSGTDSDLPWL